MSGDESADAGRDGACAGGEPLFFLDYIACGKNYPEKIAEIVKGVAEGCKQSGAALIGGETAEHPGLMPEDEYDLAGFAVGVLNAVGMLGISWIALPVCVVIMLGWLLVLRKKFGREDI